MIKKYFALIIFIFASCTVLQKSKTNNTNEVVYYATIYKYKIENSKKGLPEIEKYGYNSNGDIIEYYDEYGLMLKYELENRNLKRELFYENIDPKNKVRLPSNKWTYQIKEGLKANVSFETMIDSSWVPTGYWNYEYNFNENNQVDFVRTLDQDGKLRFTSKYYYDENIPKKLKTFSLDYTGKLIAHNVKTMVIKRKGTDLIDSTIYQYDNLNRIKEKLLFTEFKIGDPKRYVYKYDDKGRVVREDYFIDKNKLYNSKIYLYNQSGRIKEIQTYDENGVFNYLEEYKY